MTKNRRYSARALQAYVLAHPVTIGPVPRQFKERATAPRSRPTWRGPGRG